MTEKHSCELHCRVCLPSPESKWISIKEKFPNEKWPNQYLVYIDNYHCMEVCSFSNDLSLGSCGFLVDDERAPDKNVTHWMPLPELPTNKE